MEKKPLPLRYAVYDTAIGDVTLIANEKRLVGLLFGSKDPEYAINDENTALYDGIIELNQFCYGQRKNFTLKFDLSSDEQKHMKIYNAVNAIPYGETKTASELSKELNIPEETLLEVLEKKNPLPIFIPSHRVVISEEDVGHLSGCDTRMYETGEDVEIKKKLLALEADRKEKPFIAER